MKDRISSLLNEDSAALIILKAYPTPLRDVQDCFGRIRCPRHDLDEDGFWILKEAVS